MQRFNLLDEPFIKIITLDNKHELLSLKEIFKNAQNIKDIEGEMKIQDISMKRFLLSILHTVFHRFDYKGDVYDYLELNDKLIPKYDLDEEDYEDYEEDLLKTYINLWEKESFPDIVNKYLETYRDSFYLYSDKKPFYQVTKDVLYHKDLKKKRALPPSNKEEDTGSIQGSFIDRTTMDTGSKKSMFYRKKDKKDNLTDDETVRWLITYQNFTSSSDKTKFKDKYYYIDDKAKVSKGYLYDLGLIYLKGNNLFETLMLNLNLINNENPNYMFNNQRPIWEFSEEDLINCRLLTKEIDNLAELFTLPSRFIYINPKRREDEPLILYPIKLPDINTDNNFLEPMTLYKYQKVNKKQSVIKSSKHKSFMSSWKSFGNFSLGFTPAMSNTEKERTPIPGIISHLNYIKDKLKIKDRDITIELLSLEDDGNTTSRLPKEEVYDSINLYVDFLTEDFDGGWTYFITDLAYITKNIIDEDFGRFLWQIEKQGIKVSKDELKEKLSFEISDPFKEFLENLKPTDSKIEAQNEWYKELRRIVLPFIDEFYLSLPYDKTLIQSLDDLRKCILGRTKNE